MRPAAWSLGFAAGFALAVVSQPSPPGARVATTTPAATTVVPPSTAVELPQLPRFTLGATDVVAVNAPAALPDGTTTGVQSLLDRYLNNALVIPLRSGGPATDVGGLFASPALERVSGQDRAALFDEGLPRPGTVHVDEARADLTALVGPDGVAVLAVAVRIVVTATIAGAPLSIERTGELQLSAEGDDWKVSGYDIRVTRSGPEGVMTTTTTTAAP